jgi:hypothetical protein
MSAVSDMAFTPADGLANTTTYESKPTSGARAREQVQAGMTQIQTHINTHIVPNINTKLRNYMGVAFNG